jgi:hypothetical protein
MRCKSLNYYLHSLRKLALLVEGYSKMHDSE